MTDFREKRRGLRYKSLYLGLFANIAKGILLALLVFTVIFVPSRYIIKNRYVTGDMQRFRRAQYLSSLQDYVIDNEITENNTDKIADWIRGNPYVYLVVYKNTRIEPMGYIENTDFVPNPKNEFREYMGSRINESVERETLFSDATSNGFYKITLSDGTLTVAMAEYTENLYYVIFSIISVVASSLTFVFSLVGYIRQLIDRIKRFAGDVTIVSDIDMNYQLVSEGADEIATLSGNVEQMRQKMLGHIKSEQEAREANTELITSISHDIRTPLTVLMGYIEMMKEHSREDEVMQGYISATESTALRLKHLSDDMFKYSLAFGETQKSVKLDEYDATTLIEQLLSEHFVLMREMGYDIHYELVGERIKPGSIIRTDADNLMRIVDNIFSNLRKYADPSEPIIFNHGVEGGKYTLECRNKIRRDTEEAESNGIGLKTCVRLASLVAKKFEYGRDGDDFYCRLVIDIREAHRSPTEEEL